MLRNEGDGRAFRRCVLTSTALATFVAGAALVAAASMVQDPGVRNESPAAGTPLPGLSAGQLAAFQAGKAAFGEVAFVRNAPPGADSGLGPRFNSDSCVSCHSQPATGGTSPAINPLFEVATKLGARNSIPWFLSPTGPVREARYIRGANGSYDGSVHNLFVIAGRADARGCLMEQEDFSARANLAFRIPTPLFGTGLIEAIPDSVLERNLLANPVRKALLGIAGRFNQSGNDATITRFGWKAQNKSLLMFAGEAYNVEMGITNSLFSQERDERPGCLFNATPEDAPDFDAQAFDDITLFAAFARFLAPPGRGRIDVAVTAGAFVFEGAGCSMCHTPELTTGNNAVPALRDKPVRLYSDLALHNMGPGLADRIGQGGAAGDEFRTAPLWGLGQRIFLLHDGRTTDLVEAIQAHASARDAQYAASEANAAVQLFNALGQASRQNLLNFLRSL